MTIFKTAHRMSKDLQVPVSAVRNLLRLKLIRPCRLKFKDIFCLEDAQDVATIMKIDWLSVESRFRDYPNRADLEAWLVRVNGARTTLEGNQGRFAVTTEEIAEVILSGDFVAPLCPPRGG